jgi:hypothetical protein
VQLLGHSHEVPELVELHAAKVPAIPKKYQKRVLDAAAPCRPYLGASVQMPQLLAGDEVRKERA